MSRPAVAVVTGLGVFFVGFLAFVAAPGFVAMIGDGEGQAVEAGDSRVTPPVAVDSEHARRCGPCNMSMGADEPLVEIAGRHWVVCSERCAELIQADPEGFAEYAVSIGDDGD